MKKALEQLASFPFSTISLREEDYFGKIGPMFFAEKLRAKLIIGGVKVVNPDNIIVLEKNELGRYSFPLLINVKEDGISYQKKLITTINKKGLSVMFEIFLPNDNGEKKWYFTEVTKFISINYRLNEEFPNILKSLT